MRLGIAREVVAQGEKDTRPGNRDRARGRDKEKGSNEEEEQRYCRQAEGEGLCRGRKSIINNHPR